jgi:hypothetical protein
LEESDQKRTERILEMDKNMNCKLMEITPAIAEVWCKTIEPTKQRNLNMRLVEQYAQAMRLGHWLTTHQGLAIDDCGNLCDGQHRLQAVMLSGTTQTFWVMFDVPTMQGDFYTFDAIDRGNVRKIGEQLQIRHGIKDANKMAGGARVIAGICSRQSVKMTVSNTLAILDDFLPSLNFVNRAIKLGSMAKSTVIGSLAFCHRVMPRELNDFVLRVADGENISKGHPALTLRNYILTNNTTGVFNGHARACGLCSMHAVLGNKITLIKTTNTGLDFFADKQPKIVDEIAKMF